MIRFFMLVMALGFSTGFTQEYRLDIDGQPAITVNGVIYVPLEALTQAGVSATISSDSLSLSLVSSQAGGANQRDSLEGCMDETLFNGIWRIKVTDLVPITRDPGSVIETPGWGLTVELRNGALGTLMPVDTGVDGTGQGVQLAFADAQTLNVDNLDVQKLTFASLPQGGVVTHQLKFWYTYDTDRATIQQPVKFLFQINPEGFEDAIRSRGGGAYYTTPSPSFRIHLDCHP